MDRLMARGACSFRESDVRRAIRAARAAGIEIGRIEVDKDGKIVVVAGKPAEAEAKPANEWDGVGT
jgi:hypothetical protein